MGDRRKGEAGMPGAASRLHRTLLRIGVPRFMADHAAALLAANLRQQGKRPDR